MEERKSFVFYLNWHEVLKKYPGSIRLEVYDAIIEYAQTGHIPQLKPQAEMAFRFIKADIDENQERYAEKVRQRSEAGKKGMATRWNNKNNNVIGVITQHNKDNYNENEYENDNVSTDVDIKEKPSYEGKKKSASTPAEILEEYLSASQDENYTRFLNWTRLKTPYIAGHLAPLTEEQFLKLRDEFGAQTVRVCMENIENRKDLRKKYTDLYRTLINWCRREKGAET